MWRELEWMATDGLMAFLCCVGWEKDYSPFSLPSIHLWAGAVDLQRGPCTLNDEAPIGPMLWWVQRELHIPLPLDGLRRS
jgi:hypothetical protein